MQCTPWKKARFNNIVYLIAVFSLCKLWCPSLARGSTITILHPLDSLHFTSLICTLRLHSREEVITLDFVLDRTWHDMRKRRREQNSTHCRRIVQSTHRDWTQWMDGWIDVIISCHVTSLPLFVLIWLLIWYDMISYDIMWCAEATVLFLSSVCIVGYHLYCLSGSTRFIFHLSSHLSILWTDIIVVIDWLVVDLFDFIRVCFEATNATLALCFVLFTCWWVVDNCAKEREGEL